MVSEGGDSDGRGESSDERVADGGRGGVLRDVLGACGGSRVEVHGSSGEGGGGRDAGDGRESTFCDLSWLGVGILWASVFIWTWAAVMDWDPTVAVLELPLWQCIWSCDGGGGAADELVMSG